MIQKDTADVFITMRRCVALAGYGWLPGYTAHRTHPIFFFISPALLPDLFTNPSLSPLKLPHFYLQLRNVSGIGIVDKVEGGNKIYHKR